MFFWTLAAYFGSLSHGSGGRDNLISITQHYLVHLRSRSNKQSEFFIVRRIVA